MRTAIGRALHGEILKLKRTLSLRMVVIAPTLVALLSLIAQSAAVIAAGVVLDWGSLSNRHVAHGVRFVPVDKDVRLEVLD